MHLKNAGALAACIALGACSAIAPRLPALGARREVMAAERAFARTMADRDLAAFASFVSDEAVFFTGPEPLRGKTAVVAGWARFFSAPSARFTSIWRREAGGWRIVFDKGTPACNCAAAAPQ